jgi:hypothetical protein
MSMRRLSNSDYPVTDGIRSGVVWLIKKYTSFTYLERTYRLFATFIREYNDFARRGGGEGTPAFYRDTLVRLYDYQARFERGLELLRAGKRAGYRELFVGCEFSDYMTDRGFEYGVFFEEVGYRAYPATPLGLYVWADRAIGLAVQARFTLEVKWSYEALFNPPWGPPPRAPDSVPSIPRQGLRRIGPRDEVPVTGIWEPTDVRNGCPNYLFAGAKGTPVQVPHIRYDEPLRPGEPDNPPMRAVVDYEFRDVATGWQLLWEDTRYRNGVPANEAEYLGADNAFPDDGVAPVPPF